MVSVFRDGVRVRPAQDLRRANIVVRYWMMTCSRNAMSGSARRCSQSSRATVRIRRSQTQRTIGRMMEHPEAPAIVANC